MKTASLKGQRSVFEGCLMVAVLKSQPLLLTSTLWQTYRGIQAISPINWTWHMEINFRWNWSMLFPLILKVVSGNPAPGNIWSALIKRGAPTWSIIAFGSRVHQGKSYYFCPLSTLLHLERMHSFSQWVSVVSAALFLFHTHSIISILLGFFSLSNIPSTFPL